MEPWDLVISLGFNFNDEMAENTGQIEENKRKYRTSSKIYGNIGSKLQSICINRIKLKKTVSIE